MRKRIGLCAAVGIACLTANPALALEERNDTLSASVEVAEIFSLSLSNPHLSFHDLSPGTTEVLGEGYFFNEVLCRSNTGRPWYLKAQVLSLQHLDSVRALPASQLQWKVVESTGRGEPVGGRTSFHPFTDEPVLIYASEGDDVQGRKVILKFQYSLSAPPDAPAGSYAGQVVFTMMESL